MKSTRFNIELFLLLFLPHILLIFVLLDAYPYTGLGRIISIPMTLIINFGVSVVGSHLFNRIRDGNRQKLLIVISILTSFLITLFLYPQDNGSNVIILIIEDIIN